MEALSGAAQASYRELVDHPRPVPYFQAASPLEEISLLNLGSRPARRFGAKSLSDLRAIPWVFAWSQNRHFVPGWYGVGSGILTFLQVRGQRGTTLLAGCSPTRGLFRLIVDEVEKTLDLRGSGYRAGVRRAGRRRRCAGIFRDGRRGVSPDGGGGAADQWREGAGRALSPVPPEAGAPAADDQPGPPAADRAAAAIPRSRAGTSRRRSSSPRCCCRSTALRRDLVRLGRTALSGSLVVPAYALAAMFPLTLSCLSLFFSTSTRSCPHAALISSPRLRRTVASMPWFRSRSREPADPAGRRRGEVGGAARMQRQNVHQGAQPPGQLARAGRRRRRCRSRRRSSRIRTSSACGTPPPPSIPPRDRTSSRSA